MKRRGLRKRKRKIHSTVGDLIKLETIAQKAPNGPSRVALWKAHDKMEDDLLRRGEYHHRRKMRGKK
jgi:hypothetical protein